MYFGWSIGSGTNFHTTTTDAFQAGFKMATSDQVNVAGTSSATWQITGCQLEVNDSSTDFDHEDYGTTLAKCQRYFYTLTGLPNGRHLGGVVMRNNQYFYGYQEVFLHL